MPFVVCSTTEEIEAAVEAYGPAPGGVALMRLETAAAVEAAASGVYITWVCVEGAGAGKECARVGANSRCLCGCALGAHAAVKRADPRAPRCLTAGCGCARFEYVPSRPEEVAQWWLPRREGFDVRAWRAPCRCKHGHDGHEARTRGRCRVTGCSCAAFASDYACLNCDQRQEGHETVFETEAERGARGRPVGRAFEPLSDRPALQAAVLGGGRGGPRAGRAPRAPAQPPRAAEARFESGEISAAEYRELIGRAASPEPEPARGRDAIGRGAGARLPTVRLCELQLQSGARATVATNIGAPLPQRGANWTRPRPSGAHAAQAARGRGGGVGTMGATAGSRRSA